MNAKCKISKKKADKQPLDIISIVYFFKPACLQKNFMDDLSIHVFSWDSQRYGLL